MVCECFFANRYINTKLAYPKEQNYYRILLDWVNKTLIIKTLNVMKNLIKLGFAACLTAAFLFSGCSKDDNESDDQQRLVLSVERIQKDKDGNITEISKTDNKYDARGNCIESNTETTRENGFSQQEKTLKKYDGQGNLLESETYDYDVLSLKDIYTYEGNVETHESTSYLRGTTISSSKQVITYTDSNRDKIKTSVTTMTFDNSTSVIRQENTYDKDGNMAEISIFNENDELTQKTVFDGQYTHTHYVYIEGNVDESNSYKLKIINSGNKQTSQFEYFDGKKVENESITTFNSDNRQTGSESYENGRLVRKMTDFVYNGKVESFTTYYYSDPNSTEPTMTIYSTYTYNK